MNHPQFPIADAFDAYFYKDKSLRWGQAFVNFFNIQVDSCLFYEMDRVAAEEYAAKYYPALYALANRMPVQGMEEPR